MCYRCPGLSGQVSWLWQCPCLLEKVSMPLCQWHGSALSGISSSKLGEGSSPHPSFSGRSQDQSMLPLESEILPYDFSDMLVLTQNKWCIHSVFWLSTSAVCIVRASINLSEEFPNSVLLWANSCFYLSFSLKQELGMEDWSCDCL